MPGDAAELRAGIDHVVRDLCEPPPEWDEDGELPLETEHSTLWVSLAPTAPRMLLHATLVEDVADERRALIETNLLNRQPVGLTFLVVEETIRVARELDASVLVPAMLRLEVGRLLDQIDTWASELVARVGGRRPDDTTPRPAPGQGAGADQSRFDTAYSVLEELEEQERGSVGPATMARVFQQDTGLLLKAIRKTEEKIDYWRLREQQWAEDGKDGPAQAAKTWQRIHRDRRSVMRQALRLLVDAPIRKVPTDQLSFFDEDECGTRPSP